MWFKICIVLFYIVTSNTHYILCAAIALFLCAKPQNYHPKDNLSDLHLHINEHSQRSLSLYIFEPAAQESSLISGDHYEAFVEWICYPVLF